MVTLTFSDDHVPADGVSVRDLQLFFKRARHVLGPFRYFACGEYGEALGRPHYHALLFGVDFADKVRIQDSQSGAQQWMSAELVKLWPKGISAVGSVTFESAAYIARYVTKKISGVRASEHYGEKGPEFGTMSRNPGIGTGWIERFYREVYPADEVISRGVPASVPRFYDKWLEKNKLYLWVRVREDRACRLPDFENATEARLHVREVCTKARTNLSKRALEC